MFDFQQYSVLGWYDDEPQWRRLQEWVEMCSPFSQRSSYPTKYPDFTKIIKLSPNFQLHTSYSPIFLGFFQFSYASRVHSNPVTIHSFIPPGASHALPMPLTPASPARRSLEAELFSPYGAEQSAAGQGNYHHWIVVNYIFIYIYMWICIYIYIHISVYMYIHLKKIPNMLCPISLSPSMLFLLNIRGICVGNDGIDGF